MSYMHSYVKLVRAHIVLSVLIYPIFAVEGGWSEPMAISSTVSDQPNISVDLSGNAVLVWQGYDGNNYIIQSAVLPFDGSWSSPTTLSEAGNDAQGPCVGVDTVGNAVAVWSRFDGLNSIIQGATLPFQGSWSDPDNISTSGQNSDSVKVSVDFSGNVNNAVAVWHGFNGYNFIMQASSLPMGGSWTNPEGISVSGQDALSPVVAVDHSGDAVGVCSRYDGSNFTARAASYLYDQVWSSSFTMSTPGDNATEQGLDMDTNGNSVVVWSYFDGTNNTIQASTLQFGDGWTTPADISTAGQDSYIPLVVIDSSGNAIAFWVGFDGTNYIAQSAKMTSDGVWSSPVNVSDDGGDVTNISIAVNLAGNAVAVWDQTDGVNSVIQAATLPLNGSWSTPVNISTVGQYAYLPVVDVDSAGDAVAAWLQSNDSSYIVYASTWPFGS